MEDTNIVRNRGSINKIVQNVQKRKSIFIIVADNLKNIKNQKYFLGRTQILAIEPNYFNKK